MALWTTSFSRSNLPFIQTISKLNKTHLKAKHQCLWYFLSLQRAVSLNITPELKDKLLAQVAYHGKDPVSLQGMGIKCFLGENPQHVCPHGDLLHQRSLKNSRVTFFFLCKTSPQKWTTAQAVRAGDPPSVPPATLDSTKDQIVSAS